jgi:enolase
LREVAKIPSGASTGKHEALELRDGDKNGTSVRASGKRWKMFFTVIWPAILVIQGGDQQP